MSRRALVVGAGVLGACAALELHERGWQVDVVDRGDPETASLVDARILRYSHGDSERLTRSAIDGIARWRALSRRSGVDFIEERGTLILETVDDPGGFARHSLAVLRRLEVPVAELNGAEIAGKFPHIAAEGLKFAVWEPTAGVIRAETALRAVHALLPFEVRRAECLPGPDETVLVDGEPATADAVIWALGAQAGPLFGARLSIRAAWQNAYRFAAGPAPDNQPAWVDPGAEMYGVPGSADRAARAVLDIETTEPVGREVLDREGAELVGELPGRLDDYLRRRFPGLDRSVLRRETCAYATTAEERPVLGRLPGTATHWLVGGDGGMAFKHAPAWAARLADAIDGTA